MASPQIIPIDELLEPIAGDEPAGSSVSFTLRQEFDDLRKEIDPNEFDEDDPTRPEEPVYADWPKIIQVTQETLKETSKDLLTAARLTEALTKTQGFVGVRDGLQLMRRMVDECWDRIFPDISDGDLEVRAAPFNWLDDRDRGARFPTTLHMVPLFRESGQSFSWLSWKQIQEGKEGFTTSDFEDAVMQATTEECQHLVDDLMEALNELTKIKEVLENRLQSDAPGLLELQTALMEVYTLAKQILARKAPAQSDEEDAGESEGADNGGGGGAPARRMHTRDDVYRQLREAAELLQRMEPHSPIPYLILKAVEWGSMPFPDLMKAMIRDDNVIEEMRRDLGLKEQEDD